MRDATGLAVILAIAAVAVVGALRPVPLADPSLRTVLSRMEQYVAGYESDLSTLVARERYLQTLTSPSRRSPKARALVSDFLFFRSPGRDSPWLGFRDVLEVDGSPLAHQGQRLRDIVSSPESAEAQAMKMARESARYNIGPFVRTINVPVCVVAWMGPRMRDRFSFKKAGEEDLDGVQAWRVEFKEKDRPTIIHTPEGRPVISTGHVWVDPSNGRVLQTEQQNTVGSLKVTIAVWFQPHDDLGLIVPVRMTESYAAGGERLDTEASYSDYRRFTATSRIR